MKIKDNERIAFGERLRSARIKKGLTQKDLAELTGTSSNMISKYENGRLIPNGDMLINLSVVLCETINMLMCGFEDPNSAKELEPLIKGKDN